MSDKKIQEQFGERLIEAFTEFARHDLKTPAEYSADEFSHVTDAKLRNHLADVFYGARWIYKLGLALLAEKEERAAHVRSQIVDYAAVIEGMLSHCVAHGIRGGHMVGDDYNWGNPNTKTRQLTWKPASCEYLINRQTFWWLIKVSKDEASSTPALRVKSMPCG